MKTLIFNLIISLFLITTSTAQFKSAYIQKSYILAQNENYVNLQSQIHDSLIYWQNKIDILNSQIDTKYADYKNSKNSLTKEERIAKENEVIRLDENRRKLTKLYFNERYKKMQKHLLVYEKKVEKTAKTYAEKNNYDIIFIETNNENSKNKGKDISDEIISLLSNE